MKRQRSEGKKVIVLGLDGTRLETLEYLVRRGHMPNTARILSEGAYGRLRSVLPPYSAPAWVTMTTGVNPGKHGVFDFLLHDPQLGKRIAVNSTSISAKTIWQILSDRKRSACVVNVPITYPPQPVDGVLVSDFLVTPEGQTDFAYPPQARDQIQRLVPGFHPAPFRTPSRTLAFLQQVADWTDKAEQVCQLVAQEYPWTFLMNVFQATDIIQHYFYDYLQPERLENANDPFVARLLRLYEQLDTIVGTRLAMMDSQTTLLLVSDHGFTALKRACHLNHWFQERGWLSLREPKAHQRLLTQLGLSQRQLIRWLQRLDVLGLVDRLPLRTRRRMGAQLDQAMGGEIDWQRTQVYVGPVSSQAIYVDLAAQATPTSSTPAEDVIQQLLTRLPRITDPATGNPVLRGIYRREDLYSGPHLEKAPPVVFELTPGYMVDNKVSVGSMFDDVLPSAGTGTHHPDGFFALFGESIEPCAEPLSAHITDIAPTILYLMREAIPASMDGRMLEEALKPDVLAALPADYTDISHLVGEGQQDVFSEEEMAVIYGRLQDLGYLS
jgi:predicted AlkP superfamily phosphohydrolase/phosphomutase